MYGIVAIMFGGLTLALAFGLVTDAIVGARLLRALGQYPMPRRDHVVVCGVSTTGTTIIEPWTGRESAALPSSASSSRSTRLSSSVCVSPSSSAT